MKAVSSGLATHRMLQQPRTGREKGQRAAVTIPGPCPEHAPLLSLPVTVKRSPQWTTCVGVTPRYRCSACRPRDLLPTSTKTSLPPLKAEERTRTPGRSQ